jgi:hypothetical protein
MDPDAAIFSVRLHLLPILETVIVRADREIVAYCASTTVTTRAVHDLRQEALRELETSTLQGCTMAESVVIVLEDTDSWNRASVNPVFCSIFRPYRGTRGSGLRVTRETAFSELPKKMHAPRQCPREAR